MIRLFRVAIPTSIFVLVLSEFVLLTFCFAVATHLVLQVDPTVFLWYDGGFARILVVVLSTLVGLQFLDLYTDARQVSKIVLVLELGQALGFSFLVQALLAYVSREWMLPRWGMVWGSAFALPALWLWRVIYGAVFAPALGAQRILFLGLNPAVLEVAGHLDEHPERGFLNVGYVDDGGEAGAVLNGATVLGGLQDLRPVVEITRPDRIVLGLAEHRAGAPLPELLDFRFSGVEIEEVGATYESLSGRVCTKELRPEQLIFSGELRPTRSSVLLQSIYAPAIALAGAIVTLPIMLLAAIGVKLTSRGPILCRQKRVGLNGSIFTLCRFRSMYTGAVRDNPRVTPLGRWLRKLRIDELPQLWNVLRGEMSIVGPRPERPEFVSVLADRVPYYRQRNCVKPGITGWAQINPEDGDGPEDSVVKLEYDLYYIKHISMSLDVYIIFHTLKTMVRSGSA
jgi:exopolysaccharide biosynthesis polyprenyl glycosylphosphotransferase